MFTNDDFTDEGYTQIQHFYEMGVLTEDEWKSYCLHYLEHLMMREHEVLEHLKNI